MTQQLTLPLHLHHDATFANFFPGSNQSLLTCLQSIAHDEREPYVYLWGSRGVGCSHLLQACCRDALDRGLSAVYLSLADVLTLSPKLFENLESFSLICLDDMQAIAGQTVWEEAVFHLYNRSQTARSCLLVAAHGVPKELGIQLPDLVSRLEHGLIFQVHPLNDPDKCTALQSRAKMRGMEMSKEISQFLLRHIPRDLPALFAALEQLDHASLVEQRKLTIPFVKQVLGI